MNERLTYKFGDVYRVARTRTKLYKQVKSMITEWFAKEVDTYFVNLLTGQPTPDDNIGKRIYG